MRRAAHSRDLFCFVFNRPCASGLSDGAEAIPPACYFFRDVPLDVMSHGQIITQIACTALTFDLGILGRPAEV